MWDRLLKNNQLSGYLNISTTNGTQLQLIDLQNNLISSYTYTAEGYNKELM